MIGKTPPNWSSNASDLATTQGQRIGILTRHLYPTGDLVLGFFLFEDQTMNDVIWSYLARDWRV